VGETKKPCLIWKLRNHALSICVDAQLPLRSSAPVCRHSMTWLLRTPARFFFPFDIILDAHMIRVFAIFASTPLAHVWQAIRDL
jgi:hypothetical protein